MSLNWPDEFARTSAEDREEYPGGFQVTRSTAFGNVLDELSRWDGVTDVQLDSGAEHQKQNPNKPYARASFDDPSVVVRFTKDGEQMAAACDRWDNPRDNAQDLYHYLHETRMQEQRGTVTAESEYEKLRLPSGEEDAVAADPPPHEVLDVSPDAPEAVIEGAYRAKVQETHPDKGGSQEAFERVQRAREAMLDE
ncbi:J domain-containing protein [Haloplanus rallus]|uniref:J domain-containing protein n=1 Tax=Haloplanus rallus TaxID=1816183 RepID=A0A6B9F5Y5_9EURY|nr:DnaJ domain-containing protein [Haloplanus rallus]QGX95916.1 J domain-containing protein [Haloplanus rallus]